MTTQFLRANAVAHRYESTASTIWRWSHEPRLFVDLGLVGRSNSRIAALPTAPQVADHVAFGVVVAAVVTRRRSWNARTVR